ncbi:MAG: alpha-amylase family glycosyl hydrolase, partial [Myxococcota bacterium]
AADYITAHSVCWLERFEIDAVRMDTVKHVPLSYFRDEWIPAARAVRPLYLLGEVFNSNPYDSQRQYLDAGFDGLFDFRLRDALVFGLGHGGSLDDAAQRVAEAWSALGPRRARLRSLFLENHDVPRFASEIRAEGNAAVMRYHLALAVMITTPGIPQLYAGTELGMAGHWPDNRRDFPGWGFVPEERTPHEGYLGNPGETFNLTRDLLHLRRARAALHLGDYVELWRPGGSGVPLYAFTREAGGERVIVTLSTGPVRQRVPLEDNPHLDERFPDGALADLLGHTAGARAEIVDGALELDLPAGTIAVWTR